MTAIPGGAGSMLKNPWVLGGAGVLFIVLVLASRGGAKASSSGASSDLASQQLTVQADVALAQIQAGVQQQQDQTAAAVSISNNNNRTQLSSINCTLLFTRQDWHDTLCRHLRPTRKKH